MNAAVQAARRAPFGAHRLRPDARLIQRPGWYQLLTPSDRWRVTPARICSLAEIDACFTDLPLPEELAQKCADWGTRVLLPGA